MFDTVERLEGCIHTLEAQLGKDSHNSSKPPSSDGLKKPAANEKSLRPKQKRKVGGQVGHKGHTLKFSPSPDVIETHTAHFCEHCHSRLSDVDVVGFTARQVVDIPELKMQTTEHRAIRSQCPHCNALTQAPFPVDVDHRVQYGH